jgi:hypothetical protein
VSYVSDAVTCCASGRAPIKVNLLEPDSASPRTGNHIKEVERVSRVKWPTFVAGYLIDEILHKVTALVAFLLKQFLESSSHVPLKGHNPHARGSTFSVFGICAR